jgi:hypothetical protein
MAETQHKLGVVRFSIRPAVETSRVAGIVDRALRAAHGASLTIAEIAFLTVTDNEGATVCVVELAKKHIDRLSGALAIAGGALFSEQ